ncbi:MAG: hypothetical protein D6714_18330 [Bacteroidetes bacterium]|nr:MAG: hypothetical protein D6714_18330 [Bacteroidota bacterium]
MPEMAELCLKNSFAMSIPKEPRQLMINLMYIVLTALLALNVSAELLHAFFSIDKSLNESDVLVEKANARLVNAISGQAEAYSQYAPYREKALRVRETVQEFHEYVESLKTEVIKRAGGTGKDGLPQRKSDKDLTTRFLVSEHAGDQLEAKIMATRNKLLSLVEDPDVRARLENSIPLNVEPIPPDSEKKSWSAFKFQQMPVAAVLPTLTKFQHDARISATAILNHFYNEINITALTPDAFEPVISANTNYVIKGETFQGEIFLAAYSSTADNIAVRVDGRPLPVRDGKAIFATRPDHIGEKKHKLEVTLENPLTGEKETFEKSFSYVVGERSAAISLDKMNVFYVGVENPISISAAGVPSGEVRISGTGVSIKNTGSGQYVVTPRQTGRATLTISGGGLAPVTREYIVKRIPDPVLKLGTNKSGQISAGEMRVQPGIIPFLENFDFQATCKIDGFEVVRVRQGDAVSVKNKGGGFGSAARRLTENAKRGDIFYFDDVYATCPGDKVRRKLDGLFFKIK